MYSTMNIVYSNGIAVYAKYPCALQGDEFNRCFNACMILKVETKIKSLMNCKEEY